MGVDVPAAAQRGHGLGQVEAGRDHGRGGPVGTVAGDDAPGRAEGVGGGDCSGSGGAGVRRAAQAAVNPGQPAAIAAGARSAAQSARGRAGPRRWWRPGWGGCGWPARPIGGQALQGRQRRHGAHGRSGRGTVAQLLEQPVGPESAVEVDQRRLPLAVITPIVLAFASRPIPCPAVMMTAALTTCSPSTAAVEADPTPVPDAPFSTDAGEVGASAPWCRPSSITRPPPPGSGRQGVAASAVTTVTGGPGPRPGPQRVSGHRVPAWVGGAGAEAEAPGWLAARFRQRPGPRPSTARGRTVDGRGRARRLSRWPGAKRRPRQQRDRAPRRPGCWRRSDRKGQPRVNRGPGQPARIIGDSPAFTPTAAAVATVPAPPLAAARGNQPGPACPPPRAGRTGRREVRSAAYAAANRARHPDRWGWAARRPGRCQPDRSSRWHGCSGGAANGPQMREADRGAGDAAGGRPHHAAVLGRQPGRARPGRLLINSATRCVGAGCRSGLGGSESAGALPPRLWGLGGVGVVGDELLEGRVTGRAQSLLDSPHGGDNR